MVVVITGNPRCGTSILLKCFEKAGFRTGFKPKEEAISENRVFKKLCYVIGKKCGYIPLCGGVVDESSLDYLLPTGSGCIPISEVKELLDEFYDLNIEVVKYPLGVMAIETLIQEPVFKNATFIFCDRDTDGIIKSILRPRNSGRYMPNMLRDCNSKLTPEVLAPIFDHSRAKAMDLSDKVNHIWMNLWEFRKNPKKTQEEIRKKTGMRIDISGVKA